MVVSKPVKRAASALAVLLWAVCVCVLPACAKETYDDDIRRLESLQSLADGYAVLNATEMSAMDLAFTYTRQADYDSALWRMIAGVHDSEFDAYALEQDPDLDMLAWSYNVTFPNGQEIDINHLLAGLHMSSKGMPVLGSWGGDCIRHAQKYLGQANAVDGYMDVMRPTFNELKSGAPGKSEHLLADMDIVILGNKLQADTRLADLLRSYYTTTLNDYDRAYQFIALTFGNVDTSSQEAFHELVYNTLVQDSGAQLLLYMNGMWQVEGWQIKAEAQPAVQAACALFADMLAETVNGEKVVTNNENRMTTNAPEALADLLYAMGEPQAAQAVLQLAAQQAEQPQETPAPAGVDGFLYGLTDSLRGSFDVGMFRAVLLVIGGLALAGLLVSVVLLVVDVVRNR